MPNNNNNNKKRPDRMAKNTNCDTEVSRGAAVATTGDENQPRNDEKKKKAANENKTE